MTFRNIKVRRRTMAFATGLLAMVSFSLGPGQALAEADGTKALQPQGDSSTATADRSVKSLVSSVPADIRKKMQDQQPLKKAASTLRWAVEKHSYSGFTSVGLEEHSVALYWKGRLPAGMKTAVQQAEKSAPVRIVPARHSAAELRRAADTLESYMRAHPDGPIHSVGALVDGSGLQVGTSKRSTRNVAEQLPSVPVPVKAVHENQPKTTSRLDDTAPFYGGARFNNANRGYLCTTGFGVRAGDGGIFMLTAAHCLTPPDRAETPTGRFIGTAERERWDHDIILVRASTGSRIYDGGVGSGEFTKSVSGWDWVYNNEWLCHSGSFSGATCGIQQSSIFDYSYCGHDSDGDRVCMNDLLLAWRANGQPASISGDSGGPVFSLNGDRVVAKGIISGSRDYVGEPYGLIFQDFGTAWRDFGVTPLTS